MGHCVSGTVAVEEACGEMALLACWPTVVKLSVA